MMDLAESKRNDLRWIERLALEELNMDETGIIHMHDHLDPVHYLEESSIAFVERLRKKFELSVMKFNDYRGQGPAANPIKIFKISNTVNDFMLFRNSLRLIIARKSNDLISVGFLSNKGRLFSPNEGHQNYQESIHEIKANIGPFNKITWRIAGDLVDEDALVKYYLSEFIRNSSK